MQHESGGLTMDATGAENHTTILAIEPSPLEKNVIWVGTDDGNIQVTTDGEKTGPIPLVISKIFLRVVCGSGKSICFNEGRSGSGYQ